MTIARFDPTGYTILYGLNSSKVDFQEEGHQRLMDYMSKDFSRPSQLLEQYVAKKMNPQTFELKADYEYTPADKTEIITALSSIHCYYLRQDAIIYNAIGDYLNVLLLQGEIPQEVYSNHGACDEDTASGGDAVWIWYYARFQALTKQFYHFTDRPKKSEDFYEEYKNSQSIKRG
jgi:hypothetical protein